MDREITFYSVVGVLLYICFAVAVSAVLTLGMSAAVTLLMEHTTTPAEALKVLGYAPEAGIGLWCLQLSEHVMNVMLLSVTLSVVLSIGLNAFNQIPFKKLHPILYIAYTFVMLYYVWNMNVDSIPRITRVDLIISMCLIEVFSLYFFMKQGTPSIRSNLWSMWGVVVASIISVVILYITLFVTVWVNIISQFLDIWNYIDLFIGSQWNLLHTVLQIFSHIQGITFLMCTLVVGVFICCKVTYYLVPADKTADFYHSTVILWCIEFLLFMVTDEKSTKQALMDKYDFCIIILLFLILSVLALFGFVREVNDIED